MYFTKIMFGGDAISNRFSWQIYTRNATINDGIKSNLNETHITLRHKCYAPRYYNSILVDLLIMAAINWHEFNSITRFNPSINRFHKID